MLRAAAGNRPDGKRRARRLHRAAEPEQSQDESDRAGGGFSGAAGDVVAVRAAWRLSAMRSRPDKIRKAGFARSRFLREVFAGELIWCTNEKCHCHFNIPFGEQLRVVVCSDYSRHYDHNRSSEPI
jgi:hypothetical protein